MSAAGGRVRPPAADPKVHKGYRIQAVFKQPRK